MNKRKRKNKKRVKIMKIDKFIVLINHKKTFIRNNKKKWKKWKNMKKIINKTLIIAIR